MICDLRKFSNSESINITISDSISFINNHVDITITDQVFQAQMYLETNEYSRSAYVLDKPHVRRSNPIALFIWSYSLFLSGEKTKSQLKSENNQDITIQNPNLEKITNEFISLDFNNKLDSYCLYVYALVEKELKHTERAIELFIKSINIEPSYWPAWEDLSTLCSSKEDAEILRLPNHWMKQIFIIYVNIYIQRVKLYIQLRMLQH